MASSFLFFLLRSLETLMLPWGTICPISKNASRYSTHYGYYMALLTRTKVCQAENCQDGNSVIRTSTLFCVFVVFRLIGRC